MSAIAAPVVVLGVGNALRADDGIGRRVVAELDTRRAAGALDLAVDVELVAAEVPGPELLPWLAGAAGLVIIDAAVGGEAPGTVSVWRDAAAAGGVAGPGVDDLLAAARLTRSLPAAVSLVGVEAGSLEPGPGLSREVEAALPTAVAATLAEIARVRASAGGIDGMEVPA